MTQSYDDNPTKSRSQRDPNVYESNPQNTPSFPAFFDLRELLAEKPQGNRGRAVVAIGIVASVVVALFFGWPRPETETAQLRAEIQQLQQSVAEMQAKKRLGISQEQVELALAPIADVAFKDTTDTIDPDARPHRTASVNGVHVKAWGSPDDLESINVIGIANGEFGAKTWAVVFFDL